MNRPAAETAPPAWLVFFAFASIYLTWGTTYKAMAIGVRDEHLPPLLFGGTRVLCGGVVLWFIQLLRGESLRLTLRQTGWLVLVGAMLFVGGNGLITLGLRTVPSGTSAVIAASTPLWMAFFSLLLPHGDRLRALGWAGLALGMVGVFLLAQKPTGNEPFRWLDVGFCFGSALAWGIGSLLVRHLYIPLPRMTSASYQMLFGGLAQIGAGLLLGESEQVPAQLSTAAVLTFLYLLCVGSLWGFLAFNWLLGHVSAAKVGTYSYVNPAIAILIGWYAGEAMTFPLLAGMTIILLAVFLVRQGEKRPLPKTPTE